MEVSAGSAVILFTILTTAAFNSAQAFSSGIGPGGFPEVIPEFDSQRSEVSPISVSRGQSLNFFPEPISRTRGPTSTFEDFFSSSRVGNQTLRDSTHVRNSAKASTFPQMVRTTTSTTTFSPPRRAPTPNPTITSRGAPPPPPVAAKAATTTTRSRDIEETTSGRRPSLSLSERRGASTDDGSHSRASSTITPTTPEDTVPVIPELSSRGRVQDVTARDPVTRPPSTTELAEVIDVRDNLVGQSVCARGAVGDACRDHLALTAMSCTTGFCKECQQCDALTPDQWPKCCREHFLCCRPLARACQSCDLPSLALFCRVAFGRCN